MKYILSLFRRLRIQIKKITGIEPSISYSNKIKTAHYGNLYCFWRIPVGFLNNKSIVLDIGLGEDISFSQDLIKNFGCQVHGVDPTPRAIQYVNSLNQKNFTLHEFGLACKTGVVNFYLPDNANHVSGSLIKSEHNGLGNKIEVQMLNMADFMHRTSIFYADLIKIDIEGAEYELLESESFQNFVKNTVVICIEFHHRWKTIGKEKTYKAVSCLKKLGFECVWQNTESNEEFTFARLEKLI